MEFESLHCLKKWPKMHIGKIKADKFIANFQRKKYRILTDTIQKAESVMIRINATSFDSLMRQAGGPDSPTDGGLRLYFACFINIPGRSIFDPIVKNCEGLLNIVFVLTKNVNGVQTDQPPYLVVSNTSNDIVPIPQDVASLWVREYQKQGGKHDKLSTDLAPEIETKKIFFGYLLLMGMVQELDCIAKKGTVLDNAILHFGCIPDTEPKNPNKMCVFFSIRKKKAAAESDIAKNDTSAILVHEEILISENDDDDYDTGTLCPPELCDEGSLP